MAADLPSACGTRSAVVREAVGVDTHDASDFGHGVGCKLAHQLQEVLFDQPLGAAQQQLCRVGGFRALQEFTHELDCANGVLAAVDARQRAAATRALGRRPAAIVTVCSRLPAVS